MGWLSDFFGGIEDSVKSIGRSIDDGVHDIFGGFDDLIHGDFDGVGDRVQDFGGSVGDIFDEAKKYAPLALSFTGLPVGLANLFGGGLGGAMASGGLIGAGSAALNGGDIGKGALLGSVSPVVSAGVGAVNPGGTLFGMDSPKIANVINKGVSSGITTKLGGGDAGNAMLSSLFTNGLNTAGKSFFSPQETQIPTSTQGNGTMSNYDPLYNPIGFGGDTYSQGQGAGNFLSNPGYNREFDFSQGSIGFDIPNLTQETQGMAPGAQSMGSGSGSNPLMQFFSKQFGGRGGAGLGDIAGSLLGLYQANRQRQAMKGQANSLSSMFGQNSASATALRNQLNRRDAASGRRSQYGPREVELQAKLAQLASGNAPAFMNAQNGASQAQAMMMKNLLQLGNQSGAFRGLGSLFGNGNAAGGIDPLSRYLYGNMGSGD